MAFINKYKTSYFINGSSIFPFSGFYYWTLKIIGKTYNELLGKIHFLSLFAGVLLMIKINTRNMPVKGGYRIIEKYNGSNCGLAERNYTTNSNDAVNPWFVTGFSDARGR